MRKEGYLSNSESNILKGLIKMSQLSNEEMNAFGVFVEAMKEKE